MRKTHHTFSSQLAKVAGLYGERARRTHAQIVAEGPQAAREALVHARGRVRDVYVTPEKDEVFADLTSGVWTHVVRSEHMAKISPTNQGIVVVLEVGETPGLEVLDGASLAVLAAEMQDPGNAGSLIRTADAAGADAVIFGRGSIDPTSPKVIRAAAGSTFHLPVLSGWDPIEVMKAAGRTGLRRRAADAHGTVSIAAIEAAPCLWIIGNEARGLTEEIRVACDDLVAIPIRGVAESLNAAVAAALCLYSGILREG